MSDVIKSADGRWSLAVKNAASIAGLMLTTEAMIADSPDEKGDGGMGGMGGGMGMGM